MARLLLIVSRAEPAQYTYLKRVFGGTVDVILDRRMGERRRLQEPVAAERRCGDRRHHDCDQDLQKFGWAVVR